MVCEAESLSSKPGHQSDPCGNAGWLRQNEAVTEWEIWACRHVMTLHVFEVRPLRIVDLGSCNGFFALKAAYRQA